ncbi:MAG TPA: hypothetical protein VL728_18715 [Cyclobacteriaceae bacterium]|jgi:16S rRNA C967 or C1407 C5-methylase (RsmB/RsmF family)/NOL1/NOP2/fmu family ribosome biogenesis protein|nr:hypothetical protein [Cyclobacteriaceae bacterium]
MADVEFPAAFAQRMQKQLLEDWPSFVGAHRLPSPTSIRINPNKPTQMSPMGADGSSALEKIPWTEFGHYLVGRPPFTFDPLFHAGAYYVQEASSMFLEHALKQAVDLTQPLRILDLCAAPGGKSTHLLSLVSDHSLLVSNEVIRTRATILAENICKWGNINCVVTSNDPEDFERLGGFFDVVVIDAPCSGEGLFRKDQTAMTEWSEENANLCSSRQRRILNEIWPSLKQNGILIYSTCTYNRLENGNNFIELVAHGRAKSLKLKVEKDWKIEEVFENEVVGYQFYPHKVKGEGFFISVLQKTESQEEVGIRTKKQFEYASRKIIDRLKSWTKDDRMELVSQDDLIIALPKNAEQEIEFISRHLRVIQKGTAIATVKHDKLVPEHAFALSNKIDVSRFPSKELTRDQAIAFLRKDVLTLDSAQTGFTLMTYQNTPIGWANHLGNRTNNLYPSNWRIRKSEL